VSIDSTLYIGVSGLDATGNAISIVGDNIANSSTIGFKSERAEFSQILGGSLGNERLGGGVLLDGAQTQFTQGQLQTTSNPLDLAIQGGGLFEVSGNNNGVQGTFYTRDGQFSLDHTGYIVNQDGMRLQGYTIDGSGNRSQTVGDLAPGATTSPAVATGSAKLTLNLDSNDATPAVSPFDPTNSATYNYQSSFTAYDSLGNAHQVQEFFVNNGGGSWTANAMVDGGDLAGGTKGTLTSIGTTQLQFNTNGSLQSQVGALTASFANATPGQAIKMNFGDDIASGGTGFAGTTDFASADTINGTSIDGRPAGNLTSLSVGSDGKITGTYDNGQSFVIAQLALASFQNDAGLARAGNNLFAASQESGQPLTDIPGTGARGGIQAGALEASNVDISNELVTLIAYQRAYEANSKTVTTADSLLQTAVQLKQG
jgi:flagellar hook protein FlgE